VDSMIEQKNTRKPDITTKGEHGLLPSVTLASKGVDKQISLTIVVPALNEEENLEDAVTSIIAALEDGGVDWEMILVNDGSTDRTGEIAAEFASKNPRINALHHERPMGVGYSFREGAMTSSKDAVTWLPGDGENDPYEQLKWLPLLEHVDIVNPFVVNRGMRSRGRRMLSTLYLWIINVSFGVTLNYTNGTVIYRRRVFEVVKPEANGFFFQTECLIKAIRAGFTFAEVPIRIQKRLGGQSKALSLKSFYAVASDFIHLFLVVHILRRVGKAPEYPPVAGDHK